MPQHVTDDTPQHPCTTPVAHDNVSLSASELRKHGKVTPAARLTPGERIRTGKDCGFGRFPSHDFKINTAWLAAALIAATLLAWLRLLALDGSLARAEPKTLRYRILHAAARITRGARRRQLKIQASWPWAHDIVTAWERISALASPP